MLIEVKAKVSRVIDAKTRKRTETFIVDEEIFARAEYTVVKHLHEEQAEGIVVSYDILSLRVSPLREICSQFTGEETYIATLKDIFYADDGSEKSLRYQVLLWADNHEQALRDVQELSREGYDMHVEGIKEVKYQYLEPTENGESAD